MRVIDTHIHFWDLANNINNWVSRVNKPYLLKNHLPDMIIKNFKAQLHGVVHIEAHDYAIPTTYEINWLSRIMKTIPNLKYSHIAFADITLPKSEFAKIIDNLIVCKKVSGIRHILSHNPKFDYSPCDADLSQNANITENLNYLASTQLIFDCQMYPYQIDNILPAIKNSGVICIIDHLALPAWEKDGDKDHNTWQHTIAELAKLKNVFIKVSGIDMFRQDHEFDNVLDFCFKIIPSSNLIYGSNYPVSFNHDYNYWYNYLNTFNLSDSKKEQIFMKNANSIFFNNTP